MMRVLNWGGTVAFVAFFLFMLWRGPADKVAAYREMVGRNAEAKAVVRSTDCKDHGNVLYTFRAGGHEYSGNTHWLARPCDSIRPGEVIPVNFDPADPTVNTTMNPQDAYEFHRSQMTTKVLMSVFVVGLMAFPLVRRLLG